MSDQRTRERVPYLSVCLVETRPLFCVMGGLDAVQEMLWTEDDYTLTQRYADLMSQGQVFPPIIVFGNDVRDGYHRIAAHWRIGRRTIEVVDLRKQPNLYDDLEVVSV